MGVLVCCCRRRSCNNPSLCWYATSSQQAATSHCTPDCPDHSSVLQRARQKRLRPAAAAGGRPDVLASRDQEEPVAARRSKDEEDQMLRSLDRVEVRACSRCDAQTHRLLHKQRPSMLHGVWQRPCQ